ncbi:MAG: hypothetical protein HY854_02985 [Burkholderiales bacterium]|nr:hypothetical protein [Burkholderiales bacterium]
MRLVLIALALLPMAVQAQPPKLPQPFTSLQAVVDAAMEDAKKKTTLPLEVVSSEEVTWRDASLGCPRRGSGFAQMLVPGYRVQLRAGSRQFDYHASARGALVLCPQGRSETPAPPDTTR